VCCTYGEGGPVELYKGTVEKGDLIFTDAFKGTGRLIESFVIAGSASGVTRLKGYLLSVFLGLSIVFLTI